MLLIDHTWEMSGLSSPIRWQPWPALPWAATQPFQDSSPCLCCAHRSACCQPCHSLKMDFLIQAGISAHEMKNTVTAESHLHSYVGFSVKTIFFYLIYNYVSTAQYDLCKNVKKNLVHLTHRFSEINGCFHINIYAQYDFYFIFKLKISFHQEKEHLLYKWHLNCKIHSKLKDICQRKDIISGVICPRVYNQKKDGTGKEWKKCKKGKMWS